MAKSQFTIPTLLAGDVAAASFTVSLCVDGDDAATEILFDAGGCTPDRAGVCISLLPGQWQIAVADGAAQASLELGVVGGGPFRCLTAVYEEPSDTLRAYQDGSLVGETATDLGLLSGGLSPLALGDPVAFNGTVFDEVRVWRRALTAAEVALLPGP